MPLAVVSSGLSKIPSGDIPCDGPLLKGDNSATNFLGSNFGLVDWNDRGGDTDCKAADNTAKAKKGNTIGRSHEAE